MLGFSSSRLTQIAEMVGPTWVEPRTRGERSTVMNESQSAREIEQFGEIR